MDKSESEPDAQSGRSKKSKELSDIQEDILSRTLNSRS